MLSKSKSNKISSTTVGQHVVECFFATATTNFLFTFNLKVISWKSVFIYLFENRANAQQDVEFNMWGMCVCIYKVEAQAFF